MGLFGKREDARKDIERITKEVDEILKRIEIPKPVEEIQEKPIQLERVEEIKKVAPLFVKIERYEQVLNSLQEMKAIISTIKSAFRTLNETEKMREESMKIIENTLEKIGKKLIALDVEFSRPVGFREETPEATDIGLKTNLEDIKNQIQTLKTELQSIS